MASRVGVGVATVAAMARARGLSAPVVLADRARWDRSRAAQWAARTGRLQGCNFTPSSAGNQLEMWQPDTFDPATIDRELGWAATVAGMNSIRLFLHDLAWQSDPTGFVDRVDRVCDLAAGHGISVMPVLFDGIWDPDPRPGPQRAPRPGVHNSMWLQSPGATVVADPSRWPALQGYVEAVMGRFATDERVVVWDLFNEPDSPNPFHARRDPPHKRRRVGALLEQVWDWACAVDPDQPLTVGVYELVQHHPERASRVARTALERSDVVSFHCYGGEQTLRRAIDGLACHGRPLVCTEWLGRPGSPVRLAEVFADTGVGSYTWGLVNGRTQTTYSWTSWLRPDRPDRGWFHDLLHPDGTAYDDAEVALMRRVSPRSDLA